MVSVVDYGTSNLASVVNMLRKAGAAVRVARTAEDILSASKLLLPGVGHFEHGMTMLNQSGLRVALDQFGLELKRPVLGICLGAQILGTSSEEGSVPGLGWIDMKCERFKAELGVRVPHMGWNKIQRKKPCLLFDRMEPEARFYFVHSYHMRCSDASNIAATSIHGAEFTCAVQRGNIFGVQFHPEKSLRYGLSLLREFVAMEIT